MLYPNLVYMIYVIIFKLNYQFCAKILIPSIRTVKILYLFFGNANGLPESWTSLLTYTPKQLIIILKSWYSLSNLARTCSIFPLCTGPLRAGPDDEGVQTSNPYCKISRNYPDYLDTRYPAKLWLYSTEMEEGAIGNPPSGFAGLNRICQLPDTRYNLGNTVCWEGAARQSPHPDLKVSQTFHVFKEILLTGYPVKNLSLYRSIGSVRR